MTKQKPGPKPKCKECGRKEGEGHYDDCPVGLGVVDLTPKQAAAQIEAGVKVMASLPETERAIAQAYAERVWDGQSVDVPRAEKLRRVEKALEGQGLSMEGVVL
jgi:hypothetical protein